MRTGLETQSHQRRTQNRSKTTLRMHRRVRAKAILPRVTYLLTRRCADKTLFMVPNDPRIRKHILCCLAHCSHRYGVLIHGYCFLSNHYHVLVTDVEGNLPDFNRCFNSLIAKGINAIRGRHGAVWHIDGAHATRLLTDEDVSRSWVYTVTNPTMAGLTKWGSRWPGVHSYGLAFGTVIRLKKPEFFFDVANDDIESHVELALIRPNIFTELSDDKLLDELMMRARHREKKKQIELRRACHRFMGEERILKQSWRRMGLKPEDRFAAVHTVSSSCKWSRISQLQRDRDFERNYAKCMDARERGEDPEFPPGTYFLRKFHGVRVTSLSF